MSQSPTSSEITPEYRDAFITTQYLIYHQNGSLSGREFNRSYLNVGSPPFAELSTVTGLDVIGDGRGFAILDWDDDGRLDLLLKSRTGPRLQFFHNRHTEAGGFLSLELVGVACNSEAIGARVELEIGGERVVKTLHAGEGFLSQSTRRLHFGLGDATRIPTVRVRWPDGSVDVHRDLAADARYRIVQGAAEPVLVEPRTAAGVARAVPRPTAGDATTVARVVLFQKLPLAPLGVPAFDRPDRRVRDLAGSPILLTLWSSTCAPCLQEFGEFQERAGEIADAGVRIVPLTTQDADEHDEARRVLARYELEDDAGTADSGFLAALEILLGNIVGRTGGQAGWPQPTSLLLDEAGQLVAIYPGRLSVDQLLADTGRLGRMTTDDLFDTRLQPGNRLTLRERNWNKLARELAAAGRAELADAFRQLGAERRAGAERRGR